MAGSSPKTVSLQTVGCRLNQYETERMGAALYPYGFRRVTHGTPADLYIINTCTVTHRADSSSRYLINRALRENPSARVVVAGCFVDSDREQVAELEGVDLLVPNRDKPRLIELIADRLPDLLTGEVTETDTAALTFGRVNRATLKVSDGCDQHCSFCILPQVRGGLVNRPAGELIDEVNELVRAGFREVVLTGLHLGSYSYKNGTRSANDLAALCRLIARETGLPRIRLSSIEPQTVTEELLRTCAELGRRVCRHLHLPLQSGSARILKLMNRPYGPAQYAERITAVKSSDAHITVGADVIVGFPGETDDDFDETVRLIESTPLDYLHVFSYSDRAGTTAAELPDKVSPEIIKHRCTTLRALSDRLRRELYRRQIGQVLEVIPTHKHTDGRPFTGVADNYVNVALPSDHEGGRRIVSLRITAATDACVSGDLL